MSGATEGARLWARLAELLAYPRAEPAAAAAEALALCGAGGAREALARFAAGAAAAGLPRLQELYTATFDLRPACAPYLGAQLLPEDSPRRGPFLAALLDVYREAGFAPREELADHVAEVAGFLAVAGPGPARDDLVADGLAPALDRMVAALDEAANPYRELLAAVRGLLAPTGARESAA